MKFPSPQQRREALFTNPTDENLFQRSYDQYLLRWKNKKEPFTQPIPCEADTLTAPELMGKVLSALLYELAVVLTHSQWSPNTFQILKESMELERRQRPTSSSAQIWFRTGGTSGQPRFAVHTEESLSAAALNLSQYLGGASISSLLALPPYHVSGFMPLVRAWVTDGRVLTDAKAPIENHGSHQTISVVPTTLYRRLRDPLEVKSLRCMDLVFAGGAAFSEELLQEAREAEIPLCPCYGMTETAGMVAIQQPTDFLQNSSLWLQPLHHNSAKMKATGEIVLQSNQLFQHYAGRVKSGMSKSGWATGDYGRLNEHGHLQIMGRMGEFVHSGGETISLKKVEAAVRLLKEVNDTEVLAVSDVEWGERIVLFYSSSMGLEVEDCRAQLSRFLERYEVPFEIHRVLSIPRTDAGKIDREKLVDCFHKKKR